MKKMHLDKRGFSLVEMAIVLIIVGLLLGVGTSMIGPLTNLAKSRETRDNIDSCVASIISFAFTNGRVPGKSTPTPATYLEFESIANKYIDAFGNPMVYFWEPVIANTNNSICGQTTTNLVACRDVACAIGAGRVTDVAFIIASGGPNRNPQVGITACPGGLPVGTRCVAAYDSGTVDILNPNGFDNCTDVTNCPAINAPPAPQIFNRITNVEEYDDILKWVSLNELKSKIGCTTPSYRIWNNTGHNYDFSVNGQCVGTITNNQEVTASKTLTSSNSVYHFNSIDGTCTTQINSITFAQSKTADTNNDGCINLDLSLDLSDHTCP